MHWCLYGGWLDATAMAVLGCHGGMWCSLSDVVAIDGCGVCGWTWLLDVVVVSWIWR